MSASEHKLSITEKFGYSLGDAAANFVWRAWLLLPAFLTDTFGLAATQVAVLVLVMRLSDGVTDIIMGAIADRTKSRAGKYRPWVLWTGPVIGILLTLQFSTPDLSSTGKLVYAYVIYFLLTLAYTANNVPYGALMGAMTDHVGERAKLAGFRFIGAFGGGILVMSSQMPLVEWFGQGDDELGYQLAMGVFGVLFTLFAAGTYFSSTERIEQPQKYSGTLFEEVKQLLGSLPIILVPIFGISVGFIATAQAGWPTFYKVLGAVFALISIVATIFMRRALINKPDEQKTIAQRDISDLMTNTPWLMLLGVGIAFSLCTVVRPSTAYYYISYALDRQDLVSWFFLLTVGSQLAGAAACTFLFDYFGKKTIMIGAFLMSAICYAGLYIPDLSDATSILAINVVGDFFAGILPVVFFSMLGDTVDYSEWKNKRRATGLIFSAGTFINKTGIGFAGALSMLVLASYGYDANVQEAVTASIPGMVHLMAGIPCLIGIIGAALTLLYPLDEKRLSEITDDLAKRRASE